jgi:hypothetical protein
VATEHNAWREIASSPGFFPFLTPLAAGSAAVPQLVLIDRRVEMGFEGHLVAQAVREDGSAVAPLAPVLSVFDRGTAAYPTATALDGALQLAMGTPTLAIRTLSCSTKMQSQ